MKSPYFKKISITLILFTAWILLPVFVEAQSIQEREADRLYENFAYSKAAEVYERLLLNENGNEKYIRRLAYSYNKMLNFEKALFYYSKLVNLDVYEREDFYEYAQLLRINGNASDSKTWLEKYLIRAPGDQRAKKQLENLNLLLELKSNSGNISTRNLEGNTRFTDMCPTFYKEMIVYSSSKDSFSLIRNNYEWNDQPFLDLYVTEPGENLNLNDDQPFSKELNSRFHEGPVSFSADFGTIYFTRNSFINGKISKTAEGVNNLKIFKSVFDGEKWGKVSSFPFNSDNYSVGHPALSPDNKTIYFVSDMPGGFGETDIYKSEWKNGNWSKPINLGESINTKGKEMFPYIDKDGILYFSSNGQPGMGGLDIFAAKVEENGAFLILNLGAPINSQHDDFGYVINKASMSGYFTSNRPGGNGSDDIYSFSISKIDLKVICYDNQTKELMPGAKIELRGTDGKTVQSMVADKNGSAEFSVNPGETYQLFGGKKDYLDEIRPIKIGNSVVDFSQKEDIYLKQGSQYLTIEIIDKESGLIIPNALVDISKGKYDEDELEDKDGIIRMKLNEDTDYSFTATAEEYFDNVASYTSSGKVPGEYSLTIELDKMSVGKQFTLDDLYYDLDKHNIRPDAALVLDKLVSILKDNPEIRIEIGSHTDCRATAEYNETLSQKRSESVVAYLISKGIAPGRLEARGYGESQLINKCADGIQCPEADHQANRRTVVEILNKDIRRAKRGSKNVYYF